MALPGGQESPVADGSADGMRMRVLWTQIAMFDSRLLTFIHETVIDVKLGKMCYFYAAVKLLRATGALK